MDDQNNLRLKYVNTTNVINTEIKPILNYEVYK